MAVDWSNVHLAGAFILGAAFATVATLRIVKAVTTFFAGTGRHRPDHPPE